MQTIAGALMHGAVSLLSHGLPRRLHPSIHTVLHLFFTSLVVACAVHLARPVVEPLEVAMRSVVTAAATGVVHMPAEAQRRDIAVLRIDQRHFEDPDDGYGGRSPLSRERLLLDLDHLLKTQPDLEALGFDLDLSPTVAGSPDAHEQALYRRLTEWRNAKGAPLKVTLILPLETHRHKTFLAWFRAQFCEAPHVQLAHAEIITSFGLATRLRADAQCPSLGVAMQQRHSMAPNEGATCMSARESQCEGSNCRELAYHHFAALQAMTEPLYEQDELRTLPQQIDALKATALRSVLIGAAYGTDDLFETAVGPMFGVDVHAASLLGAEESRSPGLEFIADVVLGVVFGILVASLWRCYFRAAAGRGGPLRADFAWLYIVLLLAALGVVWLAFTFASVGLLTWQNIWFNPTAMLIGMLLDAFVIGTVHVALHEMAHGASPPALPPAAAPARILTVRAALWAFAQLPFVLWLYIVFEGLHHLLSRH